MHCVLMGWIGCISSALSKTYFNFKYLKLFQNLLESGKQLTEPTFSGSSEWIYCTCVTSSSSPVLRAGHSAFFSSRSQSSYSPDLSVFSTEHFVSVHQTLPFSESSSRPSPQGHSGTPNVAASHHHFPTKHTQECLTDLPRLLNFEKFHSQ